MTARVFMLIDLDRCWGCLACEVACKQELGLAVGPRPMKVEETGARLLEDALHRDFVPTLCQHCDQPACQAACPMEALYREADGTIQVRQEVCTGCGACADACPFGVMEVSAEDGLPVKCTLCHARRKDGGLPSCAQHCIGRAISLVEEKELTGAIHGRTCWRTGRIVYVSDKWSRLGGALQGQTDQGPQPKR